MHVKSDHFTGSSNLLPSAACLLARLNLTNLCFFRLLLRSTVWSTNSCRAGRIAAVRSAANDDDDDDRQGDPGHLVQGRQQQAHLLVSTNPTIRPTNARMFIILFPLTVAALMLTLKYRSNVPPLPPDTDDGTAQEDTTWPATLR